MLYILPYCASFLFLRFFFLFFPFLLFFFQVRGVEVGIVVLVLIFWAGAIALFFNRWGKIRMLLPYQPDYKEQLKVPGTGVCAAANAAYTQHPTQHTCSQVTHNYTLSPPSLPLFYIFSTFRIYNNNNWWYNNNSNNFRYEIYSAIYSIWYVSEMVASLLFPGEGKRPIDRSFPLIVKKKTLSRYYLSRSWRLIIRSD